MNQDISADNANDLQSRMNSLEQKVSKLVALLEMQARISPSTGPVTNEDYLKIGEEMRAELARYASH